MALYHVHVAKLELSFPGVPSWIVQVRADLRRILCKIWKAEVK